MSNIWDELNSFGRQMFYQNRRKYFLWRNKMDTTRTVYSDKTEEEMKEILGVTDIQWNGLKRWEESDEYKRLMYILYADNFDTDLIEIYDRPSHSKADLKNVVIFGRGQFDRSPCGTGTSAKLAALYSKGKIGLNEPFVYESISGTTFTGKVLKETKVGEFNGVVPEVTGKAFITGFNQLIIDSDDPFKYGFVLPR